MIYFNLRYYLLVIILQGYASHTVSNPHKKHKTAPTILNVSEVFHDYTQSFASESTHILQLFRFIDEKNLELFQMHATNENIVKRNYIHPSKYSVLQYALEKETWEIITFCIDNFTIYSYEGIYNKTLLHEVVEKLHIPAIIKLLKKGHNPNSRDECGEIVLSYCFHNWYGKTPQEKKLSLTCMDILIEYGADVSISIASGKMFIDHITQFVYHNYYYSLPKALKFIITNSLVERAQRLNKATYLPSIVFNLTDKEGYTLLHFTFNYFANKNNQKKLRNKIIDYLLSHGADVNGQDPLGDTILHKAIYEGDRPLIAYLLGKANIFIENNNYISQFQLLIANGKYSSFLNELIMTS